MDRVSVNSSQIESIGYDAKAKVLEVEFKQDGSVYTYKNVDKKLYTELMEASSVGSFFSTRIKKSPGVYPCSKVEGGQRSAKWTDAKVEAVAEEKEKRKLTMELVMSSVSIMPNKARSITIKNNDDYINAAEFLKSIKGLRAEVDAAFDPIIGKAHEAHKEALAQKKKAEAPLIEAEEIMKRSVGGYLNAKERERQAEEARIRKEHEDKIRAQAEEENIKRAQELAEQGRMDEAAEIVDAEISVPDIPVHVESTAPKVDGISKRTLWVIAEVNLMKLVKAVAEGKAPLETLKANDAFLGAQARAYKKAGELFPGVVVKAEDNIAAGK